MGSTSPNEIAAWIIVLFFGIGIHEYAHCKVADMCGDPTPRYYGRVTLNLFKHFEPAGTIMMIISSFTGIGLGWGRAAPIDPTKITRADVFASVIAGPASNFFQAVIYGLLFRLLQPTLTVGQEPPFLTLLLIIGVIGNLSLMLFNLIPFGPLDGHWLVGELLPEKQRFYWYRFNRSIGIFGLMIIVTILNQIAMNGGPNVLGMIIGTPRDKLFQFLTGL